MTDYGSAYSRFVKTYQILVDEPLKKYTSFNIGGTADLLALPKTREELKNILETALQFKLPVSVFGGGTNLLIRDKGIRGLVIFTRKMAGTITIVEDTGSHARVCADAGQRLGSICRFALENNLSGIEFAAGIPGTFGGALIMNAGTGKGCISDILHSVVILDRNTIELKTFERSQMRFSYRHLDMDGIIISGCLQFQKGDPEKDRTNFDQFLNAKKSNQPVSARSAGCFFKNPENGPPAGKLIEDAGLKGIKINDAMVSDIHANYIINTGNASCKDVLALKELIQEKVYKNFHIKLETEVRIEGEK